MLCFERASIQVTHGIGRGAYVPTVSKNENTARTHPIMSLPNTGGKAPVKNDWLCVGEAVRVSDWRSRPIDETYVKPL